MSKKLRGIAVGVCWLYTALVVGFMALRVEVSDLPPFLALVNVFTPFLFVPIPVVFLIVLGLWSESALVAGAIALAIFVGSYGTLFLPRFGGCDCEGEQILRVMTFNLGLHLGRPEALMTLIEDQEADIVAVQEMTSEMAQLFEQELGSTYPYRVSDPVAETTGLFSRYPIIEEEWNEPVGGGRLYLRAVVDWNDQAVTIFVVHPLPPGLEWYRNTAIPIGLHDVGPQGQVEEVTKQAKSEKGLVLIVGDFNMSDQTRGYVNIAEEFIDAYREAGWGFGFTFPKGLQVGERSLPGPFARLDYIFHSSHFRTNWVHVGCGGGSDHCYLLAQLARKDP